MTTSIREGHFWPYARFYILPALGVLASAVLICGGTVKIIACIEDPAVIKNILTHLKRQAAPEPAGLFD